MGRGGARPGAGRKPKNANVIGFPGGGSTSELPPASPEVRQALLEPPADMREAEAAIAAAPDGAGQQLREASAKVRQAVLWRQYAPMAVEQRTLVPTTLPGFRELCEVGYLKDDQADRLAKYGTDGKSGSERLRNYTKLSQRFDALLARFKLTAYGKPADGAGAKKPAANPWAQVAGR